MRSPHRSDKAKEYRRLYNSTAWRTLRMSVLQRDMFTCTRCGRIEPNTSKLVANHIKAHKGNEALFYDANNIECVCKPCHDAHIQSLERGGQGKPAIGLDGWPAH